MIFQRSLKVLQKKCDRLFNSVETQAGRWVSIIVLLLIFASTILFVFGNLAFFRPYALILWQIDWVIGVLFVIEYIGRLIAAPAPRWRYVFSFYAIIDLIAIIPMFIGFLPITFLRIFESARLLRMFRGVHVLNELEATIDKEDFDEEDRPVGAGIEIEILIIAIVALVLGFSGILYAIEGLAGTKGFESVISSAWYVIATLTTTGYGDVVPATAAGKVVGVSIMIAGAGIYGVLAGIMGQWFLVRVFKRGLLQNEEKHPVFCAGCKKKLRAKK